MSDGLNNHHIFSFYIVYNLVHNVDTPTSFALEVDTKMVRKVTAMLLKFGKNTPFEILGGLKEISCIELTR